MTAMRAAAIIASSDTPGQPAPVYRAICQLCPWASHPGGTTEELARLAATAHVAAAHNASCVRDERATS